MKQNKPDRSVWITILLALFLFLNLAFPKAGTKIGNFPLYLSVFVSYLAVLPLLVAGSAGKWKGPAERRTAVYLLSFVLVTAVNFLFFLFTGGAARQDVSYLLAYFLSVGSVVFLFVFRYYTPEQARLKEVLIASFIIITLYGLVQKIFGDIRVIIPGLTMNYSDFLHITPWWDKSNYVDSLHYIKLSSTYQNGNLFGVNYILIAWFALYFLDRTKTPLYRIAFFAGLAAYSVVCLLTFSGTVFTGLFISLLLYYIYRLNRTRLESKKNVRMKLAVAIGAPLAVLAIAVLALNFVPQLAGLKAAIMDRLFDRDLTGNERIKNFLPYLQYIWEKKLFFQFLFGSLFDAKRAGGSFEITLATVFFNSGILYAGMFAWFVYRTAVKWKFELYSIGLFTYLFVSFIDGAFWLPPTPVVFFTLAGAGLYLSEKERGIMKPR